MERYGFDFDVSLHIKTTSSAINASFISLQIVCFIVVQFYLFHCKFENKFGKIFYEIISDSPPIWWLSGLLVQKFKWLEYSGFNYLII